MAKDIFRKILDFILFGNLFISLCAVSLLWETNLLLGKPVRVDALSVLIFFSTLLIYSGHRLLVIRKVPKESWGYILQWVNRNSFLVFMLVIVSLGVVLNAVFLVSLKVQLVLLPLGAISILYEIPIIRFKGRGWRIRDVWMLKPFWITIVWSTTTVILPVMQYGADLTKVGVLLILLKRMFFIFSLAQCFDLRDEEYDRAEGIKTIPVVYGEEVTKRLYWLCMLGVIAVGILLFILPGVNRYDWGMLAGIMIAALMSYQLMLRARLFTSVYYYPLIIDGLMFLQFLWVLLGT